MNLQTVQTGPVRVAVSGNHAALPILSTVLGSVVRNTRRPVEAVVYVRCAPPVPFVAGRLSVEFLRAPSIACGGHARITDEMFDRFRVLRDKPGWDRVLLLDWDQLAISDIEDYWTVDFEGFPAALVNGHPRWRFSSWATTRMYPPEMPGRHDRAYRLGGMFDVRRCADMDLFDRMEAYVREFGCCEMAAMNAVFRRGVKFMDRRWNHLNSERHATGIRHWAGHRKPWSDPTVEGARMWRQARTSWAELRSWLD